MSLRIGIGVDAHRRVAGRPLFLGGVQIPAPFGLEAHSDGDVIIHAIIDALFGAACLGDIGTHFPPTEERYKDIASLHLLSSATKTLDNHGYRVVNVDVSIMCEEPQISPHVAAMQRELATALYTEERNISIKGTTLERMGFTGRNEGIAALAVVMIEDTE
jgi:2-C-methyl-D-erythritol 2,4-cyclodiphosphate synthase